MNRNGSHDMLRIMIAEDDPDDQFLFRSALLEVNRSLHIQNVLTGRELIGTLLRDMLARDDKRILPDLIIVDFPPSSKFHRSFAGPSRLPYSGLFQQGPN